MKHVSNIQRGSIRCNRHAVLYMPRTYSAYGPKFTPFKQLLPIACPPAPGSRHSTLCFFEVTFLFDSLVVFYLLFLLFYPSVSGWLILLRNTLPSLLWVVSNGRMPSFSGLRSIPLSLNRIFKARSSLNRCLGCLHIVAPADSAAVNMGCRYPPVISTSWKPSFPSSLLPARWQRLHLGESVL